MANTYDPQWFTQEVTNCIETENQRYVETISYNHMVHHPEVKFIKIEKIREETRVGVRLTRIMFIAIRGAAFQVKMYKIVGLIPRSTLAIEGGQDFEIQRRQFRKRKRDTASRCYEKDGEEIVECKRMRLKTEEEESAVLENENKNETAKGGREDDRGKDVEKEDGADGGEDSGNEKVVNDGDDDHFDLRKFLASFINYDHYGGDDNDDESGDDEDVSDHDDDGHFDLKKLLMRYYKEEQYDADDEADDNDDDDEEEDEKDVKEDDVKDGSDNGEEHDGDEQLVSDDDDDCFDLRKLFNDSDEDDEDEDEKDVKDEDDINGDKDDGGENENKGGKKVTEESDEDEAGDEYCENVEGDGDSDDTYDAGDKDEKNREEQAENKDQGRLRKE